ncbi:MAG TPA: kelch repeat-containing protein [Candidatus Limnocylindria bacterium]|nr:kelch repeat-containing protein [Candidatus Limnocylindria bacterium]
MRGGVLLAVALILGGCGVAPATPSAQGSAPAASPPTPASAKPTPTVEPTNAPAARGWRQLAAQGPSAREDHTWTVSGDGATAYLFGGRMSDGTALDDMWAYDLRGDAWSVIEATGPSARFGHNAAWVDGVGLVVFAGQGPDGFHDDLWAFDPEADSWRSLPATGAVPLARYGSCAALGPDGRLWISHGFTSDGSRFSDTRAYDFGSGRWTDETPDSGRPVERCLHGCWWTADEQLALFGGQTTGVAALGDLWHFDPDRPTAGRWRRLADPAERLEARQLYASARVANVTVIFGGGTLDGGYLADTWLLDDAGAATRLRADPAPAARSGAELIADPQRHRLLLLGGRDADGAMADLWELALR